MGSSASTVFKGQQQPGDGRLPRYADVDDVVVRPANHVQLSEDPAHRGHFYKMTDRPLMSLITDGEGGHRGGQGLPLGMRTNGIYFLPHASGATQSSAESEGDAAGEENRSTPLLQTVAGRSDRVYFLMGKGLVKTESPG